ncbi:MAG: indole-3-glycerol phosphate synthase TrpC [Crocinitomicaceae bacterium]|nr:indole-3-glycerol phosphate synthase TrpC [Crocinitomicaceae bacterium]MDG2440825.1 indole-3-glycerol phosphate synthase TrpC [Crocinitomicaceae bacterium]|tara:strand:+ start:10177 stop:10965 length:789 start_codon:yes stop_codon:yes gene_type:complete
MNNILNTIIETKRKEVESLKSKFTYQDLEVSKHFSAPCRSLKNGLENSRFSIIAEMKRKSPSAGVIHKTLDIKKQAIEYTSAGASAISCLTDFTYFGGSNDDIAAIKSVSDLPILRKEFILDEFQIFESKAIGADAILLIAEVLTKQEALHLTIIAQSLGMEVVMEFHEHSELHKINEFVDVIGINNRDLKAQKTDIQNSFELIKYLPNDRIVISESGIKTSEELLTLKENGFNGALIGESILQQKDPREFIESLQGKIKAA